MRKINLALIGIFLAFGYFLCGRASSKKTATKLDYIDENITETKSVLKERDSSIHNFLTKDSLNEELLFNMIQNENKSIIEKLEDLSIDEKEKIKQDSIENDRFHLWRWTDSMGNKLVRPRVSPEIDSFLENAKKDRVIDLDKKNQVPTSNNLK